jgi:uncharacterized surface protein with fasciclin (FAS1) repeats
MLHIVHEGSRRERRQDAGVLTTADAADDVFSRGPSDIAGSEETMKPNLLMQTTALAVPLALVAAAANAADLVDTAKQTQGLAMFSKAIEAAGMSEQLKGEGPFTVFAPSDDAFMQLPQGALDELMQANNKAQLQSLLAQHVIDGEAVAADDVTGQQSEFATLEGDRLAVDGTSQVVILVPAGLEMGGGGQQQALTADRKTPLAEGSDMPTTQHQQEVLKSSPDTEQRQTAEETSVPSSEHQRQAIRDGQQGQSQQQATQSGQQTGLSQDQQQAATARQKTPLAEGSDMPTTEHQQEVLKSSPGTEQRQTAEETSVPSSEHQRQVIRDGQQDQGRGGQGVLREAQVIEADIQTDNGVIHVIDAVLVPQKVLSTLEGGAAPGQ